MHSFSTPCPFPCDSGFSVFDSQDPAVTVEQNFDSVRDWSLSVYLKTTTPLVYCVRWVHGGCLLAIRHKNPPHVVTHAGAMYAILQWCVGVSC